MTYGLIGYPITHSFSQPYFTDKFAKMGLADTHQYLNFAVEHFQGFKDLKATHPDLKGLNVTIPHKQNVLPFLDRIDPAAKRIGAVNCIRIEADGTTTGYNTDYLGFQTDLMDHLRESNWTQQAFGLPTNDDLLEVFLEETSALVLGTGGASLAVHEALKELGITTQAVSRSPGKNRITYADLSPHLIADHHLIINTTPLGMAPKEDTFPDIPYAALSPAHFCYDLVYNPAETLFLAKARAAGAGTGNGIRMLHRQAEAGWKIWGEKA
ncbi:MAG: shikimate dehydrogenase [Neolewinella sp.]|jgi:shikimate dehydrogenase